MIAGLPKLPWAEGAGGMFQDLGYRGPIFDTVVRFMIDLSGDAIQHLFDKRKPWLVRS
jgi:hypothetical protein